MQDTSQWSQVTPKSLFDITFESRTYTVSKTIPSLITQENPISAPLLYRNCCLFSEFQCNFTTFFSFRCTFFIKGCMHLRSCYVTLDAKNNKAAFMFRMHSNDIISTIDHRQTMHVKPDPIQMSNFKITESF